MPHRAKFQSLSDRRSACKHTQLIEVSGELPHTFIEPLHQEEIGCTVLCQQRFCLHCGEQEKMLPSPSLGFNVLKRGELVRQETYKSQMEYDETIAFYTERLHVRGLFKEFDAKGNWLGDDDPHIVRGED